MRNTSLLLFILFLIGCAAIPYEESKVEIINVNQEIIQLDIFDSQFEKFLKSQGYSTLDLPLKQWSLQELLLAQLFFNYEIKNAKASLAWVKSEKVSPFSTPLHPLA